MTGRQSLARFGVRSGESNSVINLFLMGSLLSLSDIPASRPCVKDKC
jgi:hypothetical protein